MMGIGKKNGESSEKHRILFPFLGDSLSDRTLEAAMRLARAEGAVLIPAYIAEIPLYLSPATALPARCESAMPLLDAIEQRAAEQGVPVDTRIETGRTARHALRKLVESERFDRLVVPAATAVSDGLDPADVAWLLESAPGEVIVVRPAPRDDQPG
jgi:nucleotide-binding universal stress UspA family protein